MAGKFKPYRPWRLAKAAFTFNISAMRNLLLLVMTVVLVGCGTPAKIEIPANSFVNTLGMPFLPVPGTKVQFCIWETRLKDYAAYAAANTEVDNAWKRFWGNSRYGGFERPNTHPVVGTSWYDARRFCEWLTKKELATGKIKVGQKYRLPTDAEWSVAVGLGREIGASPRDKDEEIKDVYPWGNTWPPPYGAGNYGKILNVDKFEHTAPVGSFAANEYGLYDLGGNVWEWCQDQYRPPKVFRVVRGGSYGSGGTSRISSRLFLFSSKRHNLRPEYRLSGYGFRCVLTNAQ